MSSFELEVAPKLQILFCSLFMLKCSKTHMISICYLNDNIKQCELIIYTQCVWKYFKICFQGIVLKYNLMWHYHLSLTMPLMTKTRNLNLYYQNWTYHLFNFICLQSYIFYSVFKMSYGLNCLSWNKLNTWILFFNGNYQITSMWNKLLRGSQL